MKISIIKGLGFGLTSGIITTLGLIIGLNSGTHSKLVIIGGILTIAVADAFSDALGVHMSEESGHKNTKNKEVWESTLSTFFSKLFFALTFLIPFLLFNLNLAIIVSIIWAFLLITIFSYYISKKHETNPIKVISEHLIITMIVLVLTNFAGSLIFWIFGNQL